MIDRDVDKLNRQKFLNNDKKGYCCLVCDYMIDANESVSYRGYNLICITCFHKIQEVIGLNKPLLDYIHNVGKEFEAYDEI